MRTVKGTLELGRFEIPYRQYGEHSNLLMCVSGALQTMAIWRSMGKRFADDFTVVIFDMPGIGRSSSCISLGRVYTSAYIVALTWR